MLAAWHEADFVADVYLAPQHRVYLVDFAPWSDLTDPLLFSWSELETCAQAPVGLPVSRLATTRPPRLPALPLELTEVGGPLDDAISHFRDLFQKEQ